MKRQMATALLVVAALAAWAAPAIAATAGASEEAATPCSGKITELEPENIWSGPPPGMDGWEGALDLPVQESWAPDGKHIFNVTTPTYQAFLPARECASGAAVLVAPGGGFRLLAIHNEGTDVARWLAAHGIAAFVLKYRLVQYEKPALNQPIRRQVPEGAESRLAIADGRETLRLIRAQAARFAVDPGRVGAIGFSAGGHLVMMLGLDEVEANRPNFIGNIYGALFRKTLPALPPANLPYPPGTPEEIWLRPAPVPAPGAVPPVFMAIAQDDLAVKLGFDALEQALDQAGYRSEVHRYLKGGHGFGMRKQGLTSDRFIDQFHGWMDAIGMLKPAAKAE